MTNSCVAVEAFAAEVIRIHKASIIPHLCKHSASFGLESGKKLGKKCYKSSILL